MKLFTRTSHTLKAAVSLLLFCVALPLVSLAESHTPVVHQLRIYELFDDTREAFHERFRDHAQRIMERHDFNIVAMWEAKTDAGTEFVYLLEWPDERTMKAQWDKFMADREWAAIKAETSRIHGQFVGNIQDRTLRLADYSPDIGRLSGK
jgi:hypothetical protein